MAELILRLGNRLVISRRNKCVRKSLLFVLTSVLFIAGGVFALEVILILLGLGNVFLPLTRTVVAFLNNAFF